MTNLETTIISNAGNADPSFTVTPSNNEDTAEAVDFTGLLDTVANGEIPGSQLKLEYFFYPDAAIKTRNILGISPADGGSGNDVDPLFGIPASFNPDSLKYPSPEHDPKGLAELVTLPKNSRLVSAVKKTLGLQANDTIDRDLYINHTGIKISGGLDLPLVLGLSVNGNSIINIGDIKIFGAAYTSYDGELAPSPPIRSLVEGVVSNELFHTNFLNLFPSQDDYVRFVMDPVEKDSTLVEILQSRGLMRTDIYDGRDVEEAGSERSSLASLAILLGSSEAFIPGNMDEQEIEGVRARLTLVHTNPSDDESYNQISGDLTQSTFEDFFVNNAGKLDEQAFAKVSLTPEQFLEGKSNWVDFVDERLSKVATDTPHVLLDYASYTEQKFADLMDTIFEHLRSKGTIKSSLK